MKTFFRVFLLISVLVLADCQSAPARKTAAVLPTPIPVSAVARQASPDAAAGSVAAATPLPVPTALPSAHPSVLAVQGYFDAMQSGDFDGAAGQLSSYSLMVEEMTRIGASEALRARMAREKWEDLQVMEVQPFNDKTVLVHVTYQAETTDAGETTRAQREEMWPVRVENGAWRINFDRLIDFHTLNVTEQTTAGLTVKPRQLTRYSDRIRLTLLVQNQTNEPIVLGQRNEIMAAFLFADRQVEAEKTQLIFDRLRSYPDVSIDVKGQFDAYPDGVIIRQWKNISVAPWFTFQFSR